MDHETRVRILKQIVDEASCRIIVGGLSVADAEELARRVRAQANLLLPNQMDKFDLIYQSRLSRLIDQFVRCKELER